MSMIFAAISAFAALGSAIIGGISSSTSGDRAEQQLALQREQYYDTLTSNYYSYMSQLEEMRNSQSSAQIAINQAREDIASNQYYLNRWGEEYDATVTSGIDEAYNTYAEQASALGSFNAQNGAAGRSGGSAGLIAQLQEQQIQKQTGATRGFGLTGTLGTAIRSTAQDLLAERQTAATAINTSYQSITAYQDTIANLDSSIASLTTTTEEIRKKLTDAGRTIA